MVTGVEDEPPHPENAKATKEAAANVATRVTNRCQREGSDGDVFMEMFL
jgi:hypothetical protein